MKIRTIIQLAGALAIAFSAVFGVMAQITTTICGTQATNIVLYVTVDGTNWAPVWTNNAIITGTNEVTLTTNLPLKKLEGVKYMRWWPRDFAPKP